MVNTAFWIRLQTAYDGPTSACGKGHRPEVGLGVFRRDRLVGVNTIGVECAQQPTTVVRIGLDILKLTTFK